MARKSAFHRVLNGFDLLIQKKHGIFQTAYIPLDIYSIKCLCTNTKKINLSESPFSSIRCSSILFLQNLKWKIERVQAKQNLFNSDHVTRKRFLWDAKNRELVHNQTVYSARTLILGKYHNRIT